ncbi:hypothetical protein [Streptomyces sp. NPDC010273]
MPAADPHADPAREAAEQLAAQGEHVHLVAEGQAKCISGLCPLQLA